MKIPFVGSSSTARSVNANAEESINCFLEYQVGDDGKSRPVALYGTPGLHLRLTVGDGPHRGAIESEDGYAYFVSGDEVFRVDSSYVSTSCGTIGTSSGRVGFASNGTEVILVDGDKGYLLTGTTLTEIADVDFPDGVTGVTFINGFFVVFGDGSQKFYWNETPGSGSAWNGLDFASAEGSPDELVGGVADHLQLWFVGSRSAEVYDNTTDPDDPFQRSGGSFMQQGTVSPWTVQPFDNSVVWLSRNEDGHGIFLRSQGGSPARFSTHAVETQIAEYSTISDAFSFVIQIEGHNWYVTSFPTADVTWVYDAASNGWFKWLWRDPGTNHDHRHRASSHAFLNGKHLVGDWEDGRIYSLEMNVYTDDEDPIRRLRRTQNVNSTSAKLFFSSLLIDMETGVGNADCPDPQIMLRYSNDDGHSWSNEKLKSIGAEGEYDKVVRFGPTGCTKRGKGRVWELSLTDPVKFAVFGADAEVEEGG